MYIVVAGNTIKKFSMTSPHPTGDNTFLLQASYRIFMKRGERVQMHVKCQNNTNFIKPNSMVQIYVKGLFVLLVYRSILISKGNAEESNMNLKESLEVHLKSKFLINFDQGMHKIYVFLGFSIQTVDSPISGHTSSASERGVY